MKQWVVVISSFLAACNAGTWNGVGERPAMGWNDWNSFGCEVSEDLVLGSAKKIVDLGLKELGYEYVVLDDCWSKGRGSDGTLQPDLDKFPNGMKHVADKIHDMGLKYGMYSSAGTQTCGGYEGSLDHEEEDAKTFAEWGVDYLKYDNCHNQGLTRSPKLSYDRFKSMSDALNKTGRPIYYALCNWGEDLVWDWAQDIANAWRISGDIGDVFNKYFVHCPCDGNENRYCTKTGFQCSVMNIMDKAAYTEFRGSLKGSGWNDLDMLEVGNGKMSDEAYKTHFSMWAILKSNFLLGNDIRNMTEDTFSIITNPAIIALNQDMNAAATRVWYYGDTTDSIGLWVGTSSNGDQLMALVNGGNEPRKMNATLEDVLFYVSSEVEESARKTAFDIYDLWGNRMDNSTAEAILSGDADDDFKAKHLYNATETSYKDGLKKNDPKLLGKKIGSVEPMGTITADVPAQGIAIYRLKPQSGKSEL
ncbi:hypothetical protein TRICI_006182 [Trichomonascus ciferrii]|uniref:Alpha-galactosidase n=1 Tax=Trichomonascus ciferrii TaxID=44093 RepID=A0A642UKI6_9ASCO|nr:hypothetical protein TRICI_006182 [Trichomonascus ciferrii]